MAVAQGYNTATGCVRALAERRALRHTMQHTGNEPERSPYPSVAFYHHAGDLDTIPPCLCSPSCSPGRASPC
jgi:hypothetical protein